VVTYDEHFEICSLVGTLASSGHLHIVLGREDGSSLAGHVVGDLVVFTTAEVVIGECQNAIFGRWSNFVIFVVLPFLDFSWTLVPIRTKSRNRDLRREALFLIFSCSGQNIHQGTRLCYRL